MHLFHIVEFRILPCVSWHLLNQTRIVTCSHVDTLQKLIGSKLRKDAVLQPNAANGISIKVQTMCEDIPHIRNAEFHWSSVR